MITTERLLELQDEAMVGTGNSIQAEEEKIIYNQNKEVMDAYINGLLELINK